MFAVALVPVLLILALLGLERLEARVVPERPTADDGDFPASLALESHSRPSGG
ncbi:hypothetical protein [Amycolatopsis sp.]|jgi:hypothetical protein|uniref:hypothetical protein n=1 Tax=Amycolatopsis sp. TaxID=37632 RepID=UPI002E0AD557|nr:hypothetical protein [Amycolatopsis sp.]